MSSKFDQTDGIIEVPVWNLVNYFDSRLGNLRVAKRAQTVVVWQDKMQARDYRHTSLTETFESLLFFFKATRYQGSQ